MIEDDQSRWSSDFVRNVALQLPSHLRARLYLVNPYEFLSNPWSQLQCYGAAFSFYTRAEEGYLGVQEVIMRTRIQDSTGFQIVPTILKDCFLEVRAPQFGDIVIFYNKSKHIHAGIYIGQWEDRLILHKQYNGNLPLEIHTQRELLTHSVAKTVKYWKWVKGELKLEDVYLGLR